MRALAPFKEIIIRRSYDRDRSHKCPVINSVHITTGSFGTYTPRDRRRNKKLTPSAPSRDGVSNSYLPSPFRCLAVTKIVGSFFFNDE